MHLKRLRKAEDDGCLPRDGLGRQVLICRRDEAEAEEIEKRLVDLRRGREQEPILGQDLSDEDIISGEDLSLGCSFSALDRPTSTPSSRSSSPYIVTPDSSVEEETEHGDTLRRKTLSLSSRLGRPYLVQVPSSPPLTRRQYIDWSTYWPINARFNQRERKRVWSAEEVDWVIEGLREALSLARSSRLSGELGLGAVARPPMEEYWQERTGSGGSAPPRSGVRAIDTRKSTGHPLAHSTMNVIEGISAAERRRRWMIDAEKQRRGEADQSLPSDQDLEQDLQQLSSHFGGGKGYTLENPMIRSNDERGQCAGVTPDDMLQGQKDGKARWPRRLPTSTALKNGQDYLLTGMDLFLSHEPDALCAMALVHSRVRRVFLVCMQPDEGALESHYGIHGFKGLNHRFEVWKWRGWKRGMEVDQRWRLEVDDIKPVYGQVS